MKSAVELEKQIYLNDFIESNEENWFTFLYHVEQTNIEYAYNCLIICKEEILNSLDIHTINHISELKCWQDALKNYPEVFNLYNIVSNFISVEKFNEIKIQKQFQELTDVIVTIDKLQQKIEAQQYKIIELEGKLHEANALNSWLSSRIESLEENLL